MNSGKEAKYQNNFTQDEVDKHIWSIHTEPKFGIGQRCILLQTEHGNVLWDLITYLDDDTIKWVSYICRQSSLAKVDIAQRSKTKAALLLL